MSKEPVTTQTDPGKSSRGIPTMEFIPDVPALLAQNKSSVDEEMFKINHSHDKYNFMLNQLESQKADLVHRIPDLKNSVSTLKFMKKKADANATLKTKFHLGGPLYTGATASSLQKVALWQGAGVMIEYPLDQAVEMISANKIKAEARLKDIIEDMEFLKDQITTCQVNTRRLHNHRALQNKKKQPARKS